MSSDLISLSNVFGLFFKESYQVQNDQFTATNKFKRQVQLFSVSNKLNSKVLFDSLCFALQILKISKFIFDSSIFTELVSTLNKYEFPAKSETHALVDIIVQNSIDKCAKKQIIYTTNNMPKVVFETVDFHQTRLYNSSFVDKNAEFYVYKSVFQTEE